jgi:hypothetical protein
MLRLLALIKQTDQIYPALRTEYITFNFFCKWLEIGGFFDAIPKICSGEPGFGAEKIDGVREKNIVSDRKPVIRGDHFSTYPF